MGASQPAAAPSAGAAPQYAAPPPQYAPPPPQYQAPPPQYAPPPPQYGAPPPPGAAAGSGLDENVACALSYIPIVAIIFLLIEPYNKMKNVRFHALQSLFYAGAWFVIGIGITIIRIVMAFVLPWSIMALTSPITWLLYVGLFVLWIFLAVKAYQGQRFVLPVLGPLAEKNA